MDVKIAAPPYDKEAELGVISSLVYSPDFWDYARVLTAAHFFNQEARKVFEEMKGLVDQGRSWLATDYPQFPVVSFASFQVQELIKRLIEVEYGRQHYERGKSVAKAIQLENYSSLQEISMRPAPRMAGYVNGRTRYTAPQLAKVEFPEKPYMVDRLVREAGITLLAGDFGAGKTYASLDAAIGVAAGTSAWGRKCKKGKVLYFGLDNPTDDIRQRLVDLCDAREIALPEDLEIDMSPLQFSDRSTFPFIRDQILQFDFTYIIFDVLGRYMGIWEENSNTDAAKVNAAIRAIANETGCAFQLNHHLTKPGNFKQQTLSSRVRGAGDWLGGSDICLGMTKKGLGSDILRTLVPLKTRRAPEEDGISFSIVEVPDGGIALAFSKADPETVRQTQTEFAADLMMKALEANPGNAFLKAELEAHLEDAGVRLKRRSLTDAYRTLTSHPKVSSGRDGKFATYQYEGSF